jgi:hypothetical protein
MFNKWRYLTFEESGHMKVTVPPLILRSDKVKVLSFKEEKKENVIKSPPKPPTEKEVLNWLHKFDNTKHTNANVVTSPAKQRVLE